MPKRGAMVAVAITHNPNSIEAAIWQALGYLQLDQLVRGRLVAIKPNETWASAEDISGVTRADTLRAVLRALKPLRRTQHASTDPLAADVVRARLLGFDIQAVRHLREAQRLCVGETDTSSTTFPGLSLREAIETFTAAAYGEKLTFEHA
jgi:uncharacterized protein (DUF362 family)